MKHNFSHPNRLIARFEEDHLTRRHLISLNSVKSTLNLKNTFFSENLRKRKTTMRNKRIGLKEVSALSPSSFSKSTVHLSPIIRLKKARNHIVSLKSKLEEKDKEINRLKSELAVWQHININKDAPTPDINPMLTPD
ncbi:unnamed protein product [Blepharisma stoltei]|uniref:Uncharacterized protein n=1 Tax=Blepharisma stoltei TaxID=1481888 RepID=A0AAU9IJE0_9CILI|nr:unnamed protein product [Blepharisma stoltei]